jgi:uncharacterized membrane-anchored protein YhcB (DUF1043 family)
MRTNFKALIIVSIITSALCTLFGMHAPWPIVIGVFLGSLAGKLLSRLSPIAWRKSAEKQRLLNEQMEAAQTKQSELRNKIETSRAKRELFQRTTREA